MQPSRIRPAQLGYGRLSAERLSSSLLHSHTKIDNTARNLWIEINDAIEIAEMIDIRSSDAIPQLADAFGGEQFAADLRALDVRFCEGFL